MFSAATVSMKCKFYNFLPRSALLRCGTEMKIHLYFSRGYNHYYTNRIFGIGSVVPDESVI